MAGRQPGFTRSAANGVFHLDDGYRLADAYLYSCHRVLSVVSVDMAQDSRLYWRLLRSGMLAGRTVSLPCGECQSLYEPIMKRIILITGGQRSGKSKKAEELALSLSDSPVYLATAHIWDDEFRERVRRHQERRGPQWTNIEEEQHLSRHDMTGRVVVIDCVTLWLTNFFFANDSDTDLSLELAKTEFDKFTTADATYIFVTNEIGSGGVSENAIQRKFTDLEGWMNQYIASKADEVILMVSGIPVKVKG